MICPKCEHGISLPIYDATKAYVTCEDAGGFYGYDIAHGICPVCQANIIVRREGDLIRKGSVYVVESFVKEEVLYPPTLRKRHVSDEVPERYKNDFQEAFSILLLSPKASAAISRRVLQDIFHNHFKIEKRNLLQELDEFISRPGIPSELTEQMDAIRNIGNFAAHPTKNINTGELIDVEPGEAEWLLDTLEDLFDYAFVKPKKIKKQKDALNEKLKAAGKQPLKGI